MSEETSVTEATEAVVAEKTSEPKRNSIPNEAVAALIAGIPQYEKTSFNVVGHKGGVRLALPKTNGVGRAYFYGNGDYSLVPSHPAITSFSEEERKAARLGGIMAEVNFELGVEAATEALTALIEVVRNAPAPAPKAVKQPKTPWKPKAAPDAPAPSEAEADPAGN